MGIEKKTKVQTFEWHSISWSPPFESTTQALKNALFLFSRYNSQSNQMDFPERFWLLESWQMFGSSISLLSIILVKLASVSLVYLTIETFLPYVLITKERWTNWSIPSNESNLFKGLFKDKCFNSKAECSFTRTIRWRI